MRPVKGTKLYRALAAFYWSLQEEAGQWLQHLLMHIPGAAGVQCRSWYYRRAAGSCGKELRVLTDVRVSTVKKLHLGDRVNIAAGCFITAGGTVRLGNGVLVGPDTKIWSVNHIYARPDVPVLDQGWEQREVVIEDDVWLGTGVIVLPGTVIGKGAVIAAGTVLQKRIPPYALVAGNPGRVIGWRDVTKAPTARAAQMSASEFYQ